jgi:hypothetical protein
MNQQFSNGSGLTNWALGNCKDKSKMAISHMIWFRFLARLIRLGYLDQLEELPTPKNLYSFNSAL